MWRQRLGEGESNYTSAEGFVRAGDGESTLVSGLGGAVRAWDAADGRLVWDLGGIGIVKGLEVLEIEGIEKDILVSCQEDGGLGVVRRLSAKTGMVKWEFRDERLVSPSLSV